ncbi:DUF1127 domain-containing protein [Phreatobacter stygius]|uniref:DUF1127 domain-containing protein n=1 Tax=Phreatobacter stygius TaxID=1940610 RepID=A0A4D7BGK1_9HYPH|nr:DUF1127 domain-containing protein [Phreatobacter stygius]QCI68878.1 DUF1127 domain-containing protein [Phreatobacter stygius]
MTLFTLHSDAVHNSGPTLFARLQARAFRLFETIAEGYYARRTAAELRTLSDHALRDIGISRSEIDRVSRFGR